MLVLGMMQAMESRLAIAYAVARQWFGVLIRPRTPADTWLVEGLAGYLHDLFLRRFLGKNELRYRCSPILIELHLRARLWPCQAALADLSTSASGLGAADLLCF